MSVRNHCPTVPVLQNPHKRKTVSPTTTPPPGNILRKIKRFPFEPPPKFFGIVAFLETILCDLFDSWPKITQEIRSFFVDWAECLHGYRYEEVFGNQFSIFLDCQVCCLLRCRSGFLGCTVVMWGGLSVWRSCIPEEALSRLPCCQGDSVWSFGVGAV